MTFAYLTPCRARDELVRRTVGSLCRRLDFLFRRRGRKTEAKDAVEILLPYAAGGDDAAYRMLRGTGAARTHEDAALLQKALQNFAAQVLRRDGEDVRRAVLGRYAKEDLLVKRGIKLLAVNFKAGKVTFEGRKLLFAAASKQRMPKTFSVPLRSPLPARRRRYRAKAERPCGG